MACITDHVAEPHSYLLTSSCLFWVTQPSPNKHWTGAYCIRHSQAGCFFFATLVSIIGCLLFLPHFSGDHFKKQPFRAELKGGKKDRASLASGRVAWAGDWRAPGRRLDPQSEDPRSPWRLLTQGVTPAPIIWVWEGRCCLSARPRPELFSDPTGRALGRKLRWQMPTPLISVAWWPRHPSKFPKFSLYTRVYRELLSLRLWGLTGFLLGRQLTRGGHFHHPPLVWVPDRGLPQPRRLPPHTPTRQRWQSQGRRGQVPLGRQGKATVLVLPREAFWADTSQSSRGIWCGFNSWVGKIHWRRKWQPTPEVLLGRSQGQSSLAGYSLWSYKELDTT